MINIAKYVINKDDIMVLRISKDEFNENDVKEVIKTVDDISIDKITKPIDISYRSIDFSIRTYFSEGRQIYNISTLNLALILEFDKHFDLHSTGTYNFSYDVIYELKSEDSFIKMCNNVRSSYNSKYFTTSENYIDLVLYVLSDHIVNDIKAMIDRIKDKR